MRPQDRVNHALERLGLPGRVVEFEVSTETAADAAAAVGCDLGQIVKTLLFLADGRPTLALVAGDRQVDTHRLARILGVGRKKLKMGNADQVLAATGYEVGAVAPVGIAMPCDVVVDASLSRFEDVWAAAGAGNAVFPARTTDLVAAVNGQWGEIVRDGQ